MDILYTWPFFSLALGSLSTLNLCFRPWLLTVGGESDLQSFPRWQRRTLDPRWWMQLALPLYMVHQFEEHGYDFLGRRYYFYVSLCQYLVG